MRHSRLWKVHGEWKAAQRAASEVNRDTAMTFEVAQPASLVLLKLQGLLSAAVLRLRWMRTHKFANMWAANHDPAMYGRATPGPEPVLGPLRWPTDVAYFAGVSSDRWLHMAPAIRDFSIGDHERVPPARRRKTRHAD